MSAPENVTETNNRLENGCRRARNKLGFIRRGCLALCFATLLAALLSGCAGMHAGEKDLPPLLAQDELLRPYDKVAVVAVSRERFGAVYEPDSGDYDWAYCALRKEAAKIGADAVILPEVKVESTSWMFFPASNVTGRATAIKFR